MAKHQEKNEKEEESPLLHCEDLVLDDHGGMIIGLREKREEKKR